MLPILIRNHSGKEAGDKPIWQHMGINPYLSALELELE